MKKLLILGMLLVSFRAIAEVDTLNEKILLNKIDDQSLYVYPILGERNGEIGMILFTIETKTDTTSRFFASYKAADCINKSGLAHFTTGYDNEDYVHVWNNKDHHVASMVARYACNRFFHIDIDK